MPRPNNAPSGSRNWRPNDSRRGWAKTRLYVLDRDGWRCQVQIPGVCTGRANEAHHTRSRAVVGDDPNFIVASCRACNLAVGDPEQHDPDPARRTQW